MDDVIPQWLLRFQVIVQRSFIHIFYGCVEELCSAFWQQLPLLGHLLGFHSIKNLSRQLPSLTVQVYIMTKLLSLRKDRLKTQRTWRMISLTLLSASCFVRGSLDCCRRLWKRPSWCPISAFTSFLCSSHRLLWPIMLSSCWSRASTPCCVLSHWLRTLSTTDRQVKIRQQISVNKSPEKQTWLLFYCNL